VTHSTQGSNPFAPDKDVEKGQTAQGSNPTAATKGQDCTEQPPKDLNSVWNESDQEEKHPNEQVTEAIVEPIYSDPLGAIALLPMKEPKPKPEPELESEPEPKLSKLARPSLPPTPTVPLLEPKLVVREICEAPDPQLVQAIIKALNATSFSSLPRGDTELKARSLPKPKKQSPLEHREPRPKKAKSSKKKRSQRDKMAEPTEPLYANVPPLELKNMSLQAQAPPKPDRNTHSLGAKPKLRAPYRGALPSSESSEWDENI